MFQSAPGFGAGGNRRRLSLHRGRYPFQSAPGFGAGGNVSLQSPKPQYAVSIRPRLWGRGKRRTRRTRRASSCFNPPPALGPGETWMVRSMVFQPRRFNPPPALGPGETEWDRSRHDAWNVSIRPRLWGRGKQIAALTEIASDPFQSAPGFGAGGNICASVGSIACASVSIRPRLWGRGKLLRRAGWIG